MSVLDRKYMLRLDLSKQKNNTEMEFNISDNQTSDFSVKITHKGKPVDLTDSLGLLVVTKPSGKVEIAEGQIIETSSVYFNLQNNCKDEVGIYSAYVVLGHTYQDIIDDKDRVLLGQITYVVNNDTVQELQPLIPGDDNFQIMIDIITRLQELESNENARILAEQLRVQAEQARVAEHNSMVETFDTKVEEVESTIASAVATEQGIKEAEAIRVTSENTRINNETDRQHAESDRVVAEKKRVVEHDSMMDSTTVAIANINSTDGSIKEAESKRVLAEQGRVDAENIREQAIEKVKTDIVKLINDTNKKIDDYKLEKDTAIQQDLEEYKSTTTQDINTYKNDKNLEIDNYKKLKDAEINKSLSDYKNSTTTDINNYKNSKDRELDNYKAEKDLEIDNYISSKNAELDKYVTTKNTEIDEYKDLKDTLINDKLREVDVEEQKRAVAEQQRVTEHTERENFLNGFESQLGQIETDVNDLKNNGTGGNANIDDTQVSTDNTWSSDKISTWSMEQDGVFWTEKEGNFTSVDDTYEYKLREVEIFGDTWQDTYNSKNLFDKDNINLLKESTNEASSYTVEGNTVKFEIPNSENQFKLRIRLDRSLDVSKSYKISYSSYRAFVNGEWVTSGIIEGSQSIGEGNIFNVGFIKDWLPITKFEITNLQIEEGTVATSYEPYHKADLSNIQHAGELYVDEEGQPILDSEGREQYKINIEICNANLIKPNMEMVKGTYHETTGVFTENPNANGRCTKDFIRVGSGGKYSYKYTSEIEPLWLRALCFDNNYRFLGCPLGIISSTLKNSTFNMPTGTEFIKIQHLNGDNVSTSTLTIIKSDTTIPYDIPHKSHKQTILLPCQLMKVGDVKDRLFWDESKGRYVVEKKVFKKNLLNSEWVLQTATSVGDKQITIYRTQIENSSTTIRNDRINLLSNSKVASWNTILSSVTPNTFVLLNNNQLRVQFEGSIEECKLWANDKTIYYELGSYELIETNITTPITIQTYNNKTHVYVANSNNTKATIKAKFPLKTASAVASVKELGLKNSNSIQEQYEVNQNQDNLIDISLCATDEMYMMIEPLLSAVPQTMSERMVSKMVDMYVAMVIRGLKRIEEVPARYREQVKEILAQLEK